MVVVSVFVSCWCCGWRLILSLVFSAGRRIYLVLFSVFFSAGQPETGFFLQLQRGAG
jgi:hypothetical protein